MACPDQTKAGRDAAEAAHKTGGMLLPEVAPDFRDEVRKLLETAHGQIDRGKKHVELPCPRIESGPASEFKTRGFFCMSFPWLFTGGVGRFFDDRPSGEGFTFEKWLEHIVFYYDGRFSADSASPFVALNMMYRRRSIEQSGWFLKSHVEDAPANAAEIQDKLSA